MDNSADHNYRLKSTLIGLVVLAAVIAAIILFLTVVRAAPAPNAFISGTRKNQGAALYVPSTLKLQADNSKNIKIYQQSSAAENRATNTTVALTSSSLNYVAPDSGTLAGVLNSKTGAQYNQFESMMTNFILNNSASGVSPLNLSGIGNNKLTLSSPVVFTNPNIGHSAWEIDYKLKRPGIQPVTVDGKFIYVIGDNAYYRLLVSSVDANWQSNQKTWDKITDSLQINR